MSIVENAIDSRPNREVTRQTVAGIVMEPTPFECTQPAGVTIVVEPVSSISARFHLTGLQAGESPIFVLVPKPTATYSGYSEIPALYPADENGQLTHDTRSLEPFPDSTENSWTVKVIHAQGVTCLEFTLP